jgi:hypothetical protein
MFKAFIEFQGTRGALGAGATVPINVLDQICHEWLQGRGYTVTETEA